MQHVHWPTWCHSETLLIVTSNQIRTSRNCIFHLRKANVQLRCDEDVNGKGVWHARWRVWKRIMAEDLSSLIWSWMVYIFYVLVEGVDVKAGCHSCLFCWKNVHYSWAACLNYFPIFHSLSSLLAWTLSKCSTWILHFSLSFQVIASWFYWTTIAFKSDSILVQFVILYNAPYYMVVKEFHI